VDAVQRTADEAAAWQRDAAAALALEPLDEAALLRLARDGRSLRLSLPEHDRVTKELAQLRWKAGSYVRTPRAAAPATHPSELRGSAVRRLRAEPARARLSRRRRRAARTLPDTAALATPLRHTTAAARRAAPRRAAQDELVHALGADAPLARLEMIVGEAVRIGLAELPAVQSAALSIHRVRGLEARAAFALEQRAPLDASRALLAEAAAMPAGLTAIPRLAAAVAAAGSVADKAAALLRTRRGTQAELRAVLSLCRAQALGVREEAELEALAMLADWWAARLEAMLCKPDGEGRGPTRLLRFLKDLAAGSAGGADGKAAARARAGGGGGSAAAGRKAAAAAASAAGGGGDDDDDGGAAHCPFCTGAEDPRAAVYQAWICCDACEVWYHNVCVHVGPAQAESLETFLCPGCAHRQGLAYAFRLPDLPRRTRRPRLRLVRALLAEAEGLGVLMAEAEPLGSLVADAEAWQEAAQRALATTPPPTHAQLQQLVALGDRLEVEAELLPVLRHALNVRARARVCVRLCVCVRARVCVCVCVCVCARACVSPSLALSLLLSPQV
jgi:hypothetical protein